MCTADGGRRTVIGILGANEHECNALGDTLIRKAGKEKDYYGFDE